MQECSTRYKAAMSAGAHNGKSRTQFRKEECGSTASATGAPAPQGAPAKAQTSAPQTKGNSVIPTAVSPTHVRESVGGADAHLS